MHVVFAVILAVLKSGWVRLRITIGDDLNDRVVVAPWQDHDNKPVAGHGAYVCVDRVGKAMSFRAIELSKVLDGSEDDEVVAQYEYDVRDYLDYLNGHGGDDGWDKHLDRQAEALDEQEAWTPLPHADEITVYIPGVGYRTGSKEEYEAAQALGLQA